METIHYSNSDLDEVVNELKRGKVIAFPTDTVYGLGVIYYNEDALQRLKCAKGRPDEKPIPTMVANAKQLEEIGELSEDAKKLVKHFMPGAMTLLIQRKKELPAFHSNGLSTIGVRMPNDAFILKMITKLGMPMLVTSANVSSGPNCFQTSEVLAQLDGRIDGIIEGVAKGESASTIVDTTQTNIKVVREGPIGEEAIQKVLES